MGGILLEVDTAEDARRLADAVKMVVREETRTRIPGRKTPILLFKGRRNFEKS